MEGLEESSMFGRLQTIFNSEGVIVLLRNVKKLVEQFQKNIDKANVYIKKLKIENNKLYNVIKKFSPSRKFENQGKTFLEVGKRQQKRKLQTFATRAKQALWFCESFGLHVHSIKLIDEFGKDHCLSIGSKRDPDYIKISLKKKSYTSIQ